MECSIFEPEKYLFSKKTDIDISNYISCFRKGIIIGYKPLYYLLKGSYFTGIEKQKILTDEERISHKCMLILLNKIKSDIGEFSIYITPHIFTKLVNELREDHKIDTKDFGGIILSLLNTFSYIKEEELKKDEIICFDSFKNKYCGLSETAIILLRKRMGKISVIDSSSNKVPELGGDNYLFIDFHTLFNTIKEHERRAFIS